MKINTIKLNNIGPYKNLNIFNFTNNLEGHNVTLIGGKNGTGKTTLLKSIKIGLFGCFAFGFKNANSTYYKEIKNMLNNKCDETSDFFIEISFSIIESYKEKKYIINRNWNIKNNNINEKLTARLDGNVLNEYETLELENKLRSLTSPALINSFIYDGEKISSMIEFGQMQDYIKEMFNSIFNIDLIEQLSQDLTNYMIRSYKQNNKSIEYEITQTLNMLNFVKLDIKTNEGYATNICKELENINIEISSKKKEFETLGGIPKEEITNISMQISEYEKKKEENNSFIKTFCEDYLHLIILLDDLKQILKKAKAELPLRYARQLDTIQKYLKTDLSSYIALLNKKSKQSLFDLDENEIQYLNDLIIDLNKIKEQAIKLLNNKNSIVEDIWNLKDKVDKNSNIERILTLSQEIDNLQNLLITKKEELGKVNVVIKEKNQQKENLIKKYDVIADNVKKDKLANSSYIQCTNSLKLCEIFKEKVVNNKLMEVANKACEIFNKTIRKNNYVKNIKFENDFSFKLFDESGTELLPQILSAGEMQLLVSSLIWAMFKVSKRKELFVFDTPLARLDTENRIQFIKNIILTISDQVVILSTDSEFIGKNLKAIEKNLANKYLLEYDDITKTTIIKSEYFGE